jgi:hypothetical protein
MRDDTKKKERKDGVQLLFFESLVCLFATTDHCTKNGGSVHIALFLFLKSINVEFAILPYLRCGINLGTFQTVSLLSVLNVCLLSSTK